jgi:hypothetical protein
MVAYGNFSVLLTMFHVMQKTKWLILLDIETGVVYLENIWPNIKLIGFVFTVGLAAAVQKITRYWALLMGFGPFLKKFSIFLLICIGKPCLCLLIIYLLYKFIKWLWPHVFRLTKKFIFWLWPHVVRITKKVIARLEKWANDYAEGL